MKKILPAMLLAGVTAIAQTTTTPAQPAPAQQPAAPAAAPAQPAATPAPPAPATQKKEIKDPAEYNAYMGADGQQDPAAKISGFEAFVTQYPNSVMKEEALESLMAAYQKTGNQAKMTDTAQRILQVNPSNLKALVLIVFTKRAFARTAQDLADAAQYAEKGLEAPKSAGMSDSDFQKLKTVFNGAIGMNAYQNKDNAKAQQYLRAAVDSDPTDTSNIYPLALSYLSVVPSDKTPDGLFFIARAANLIQDAKAKADVIKFGKSKYVKYHGSDEGWNELLAQTATTTLPGPGFTVKQYVPPTPAEQAADLVKTKKVEEMSFAEWQLVLSEGKPEDADKVWGVLKGKPLQMVGHIISIDSSSPKSTKLMLAGSSDDVDAKRGDIDLTMSAAIPARQMPKADTDFQFEGTPVSYVAKPFVMTMNDGAMIVKAAPKPAPHPVRKKPAAQ